VVVVAVGEPGDVVDEMYGRGEVLELEYLLDLEALSFPVPQLVEALLDLFVFQQVCHSLSSAVRSPAEHTADDGRRNWPGGLAVPPDRR